MKTRAVAGILIVLAGCFVAAFPLLKAVSYEHSKNKVLNQWEQIIDSSDTIQKPFTTLSQNMPEQESNTAPDEPFDEDTWEEDTSVPYNAGYVLENMEGVVTIDKINLRYPILREATKYNLNLTVCAVTGSPKMGEVGNYCLAGHRSRVYGRQFNRLTELRAGDIISLSNNTDNFDYVVVETMQVNPEDIWVLEDMAEEKLLTLITCDYTVKPTGRFIVKCQYIEAVLSD